MNPQDAAPQRADFLLTNFTHDVPHVSHAVAVSADGVLLASSADLPTDRAEQLAAIAAGLVSLADGAARLLEAGAVVQNVVEMAGGLLFLVSMGDSGSLLVLAARQCDIGNVGYQLMRLVEQVGNILNPDRRVTATT